MPLARFDIESELDAIPAKRNRHGIVWTAPVYSRITHATFSPHRTKADVIDLHSARPTAPAGRVIKFDAPFFHTADGAFFRNTRASRPRGERERAVQTTRAEKRSGQRPKDDAPPDHGTRLVRFNIASELDGIPPERNIHGYIWTAPRYLWITHAAFRQHKAKPDVIALYGARPIEPKGRVLKFIVPFVHTAHGVFYRPHK
jgi:hypothetical protein